MKQNNKIISSKVRNLLVTSIVLVVWMLLAVWQMGGMSFYAFALMLILVVVEHGLLVCLVLKEKISTKRVVLLAVGINMFVMLSGMILSAVLKKEEGFHIQELDKNKRVSIEMVDSETVVTQAINSSVGVLVQWNMVDSVNEYCVFRQENGNDVLLAVITSSDVYSYIDSAAVPGQTYSYSVVAYINGDQLKYVEKELVAGVKETEPDVVVVDGDKIKISWNAIDNVQGYHLYKKINDKEWTELADIGGDSQLEYIDEDVKYGVRYNYGVCGYVENESGRIRTQELNMIFPKTVVNVECVAEENREGVLISWERTLYAEKYNVYRKTKDEKYQIIYVATSDENEYFDENVVEETEYYYVVRAIKDDYLNQYDAVILTTEKFPKKEKQLVASLKRVEVELNQKDNKIVLKWNTVEQAKGYHVYRKEGNAEYELITTIENIQSNSFTDSNVEKERTYLYYVCAFVGDQEGTYTGAKITVK